MFILVKRLFMKAIHIDPDIRKAQTPPTDFYTSAEYFQASKSAVFASSWQYVCDVNTLSAPQTVYPFEFLDSFLPEPLLMSTDQQGQSRCLSNVCTHRGKILVEQAGKSRQISCGYHGRCFRLDGSFKSMPCFEQVEDFPTEKDNLQSYSTDHFAGLQFCSLNPAFSFKEWIQPVQDRLGWLPLDQLKFVESASKDYEVQAHWALYCDNYLEGFHIPFVHPALNNAIEFDEYFYETFPFANLQVGIAKEGEPAFDLPSDSPDYGKRIYAYYFFMYPNIMLNFYPWGLSLNLVKPISKEKTRVEFKTYVFPEVSLDPANHALDETELEDEAVVESVQKGLKGTAYTRGRYAPEMEINVHHFHRLLFDQINQNL